MRFFLLSHLYLPSLFPYLKTMHYTVERTVYGSICSVVTVASCSREYRILLDCGLRFEEQSDKYLTKLREVAPSIDAALLSSAFMLNCGALPYVSDLLPRHCKIFVSLPTAKLARISCMEYLLGTSFVPKKESFSEFASALVEKTMSQTEKLFANIYTSHDISKTFAQDRLHVLNWGERALLDDTEICFQAFPSGYCIGGTIWRIASPEAGLNLLYSRKLGSFNGDFLRRRLQTNIFDTASLLVAEPQQLHTYEPHSSVCSLPKPTSHEPGYKDGTGSYNILLEKIIETLFIKKGTVVIPTDAGEHMVPILALITSMWGLKGFEEYPVVVLSHTARSFLSTVKSLTNFMSEGIQNSIFQGRENVLDATQFEQIIPMESMDEFTQRIDQEKPKVIISTPSSLQYGFSQELLFRFGRDAQNVFLFDGPPTIGSLAHQLLQAPVQKVSAMAESAYHRSSAPAQKVRNVHFYLKCRASEDVSESSLQQSDQNNEVIHQENGHSDGDPGALMRESTNGAQAAIDNEQSTSVTSEESSEQLPAGVYALAGSKQAKKEQFCREQRYPNPYGELINELLLHAWGIEFQAYLDDSTAGSAQTQRESSDMQPSEPMPFRLSEVSNDNSRYRDQLTFNATKYESYKVSLPIHSEVAYVNLENVISIPDFALILRSALQRVERCCLLGKIPPLVTEKPEYQTLISSETVQVCDTPSLSMNFNLSLSPKIDIGPDVFESGITYNLADPSWDIVSVNGLVTRKPNAEEPNQCANLSLQKPHSLSPVATSAPIFIGESSLTSIQESLQFMHIPTDIQNDMLLANDACLVQHNVNHLCTENLLSMESLTAQDALLRHYVEI